MSDKNRIYNLYSSKINQYHSFVEKVKYEQALTCFFQSYLLANRNIKTVLDAGCGSGIVTRALSKSIEEEQFKSMNITGFDINPSMLVYFANWIKQNKHTNVEIVKTDIFNLNKSHVKQNHFNLVVSSGMLEYLEINELSNGLKQLVNTLKSNGKLLVFISKNSLLNFFLIKLWWKAHLYTKGDLKKTFLQAGLKNVTFYTFPKEASQMNAWGIIIEGTK